MQESKEIYQKPTLISVQLIPSENILVACEQGTSTGEYPAPFPAACYPAGLGGCQDQS